MKKAIKRFRDSRTAALDYDKGGISKLINAREKEPIDNWIEQKQLLHNQDIITVSKEQLDTSINEMLEKVLSGIDKAIKK